MNSRGFIVGIVIGAVITAGLFMLMRYLIEMNDVPPPNPQPTMEIDVTRDADPPPGDPRRDEPVRPSDEEEPDVDLTPRRDDFEPRDDDIVIDAPPVDRDIEIETPPLDSEPQPYFRVEPRYPISELRRERDRVREEARREREIAREEREERRREAREAREREKAERKREKEEAKKKAKEKQKGKEKNEPETL